MAQHYFIFHDSICFHNQSINQPTNILELLPPIILLITTQYSWLTFYHIMLLITAYFDFTTYRPAYNFTFYALIFYFGYNCPSFCYLPPDIFSLFTPIEWFYKLPPDIIFCNLPPVILLITVLHIILILMTQYFRYYYLSFCQLPPGIFLLITTHCTIL